MSRIEKALEKAAHLRSGSNPGVERNIPASTAAEVKLPSSFPQVSERIRVDNPYLISAVDPNSPISEEYRKLKSILVKLTRQDDFQNTIMVTSAVAGEGKSVTSLNMAISLAQEFDHTVLLIDADLRKPAIHNYLGIDAARGLIDCLVSDIDPGEVLIKTGIGKLVVLPAGRSVSNPVELFTSQKMSELLHELKHRYPDRYVIIDTPPLLPFAETRHLSHLVDGVVFVVKEGLASMESVKDALEALKGANLLGLVYNEAAIDRADDRYNYHYRYYASPSTAQSVR